MAMMMVRIQVGVPGCVKDVEGSRHPLAMLSCGTPVEQEEKSNQSKPKLKKRIHYRKDVQHDERQPEGAGGGAGGGPHGCSCHEGCEHCSIEWTPPGRRPRPWALMN